MTGTLPDLAPDLSAVLERHADRLDLDLIDRALRFSASAHRGQKRMSGEDFVSHSIAVALILAEQLLDLPLYDHVIIAGDRFVSFATAGLL